MINTRRPTINNYLTRDSDYVKTITVDETIYGLAEIQGLRDDQEDAMACVSDLENTTMQQVRQMDDVGIRSSYQNCFIEIQDEKGQFDEIGSTCCSATAWLTPETNLLTV